MPTGTRHCSIFPVTHRKSLSFSSLRQQATPGCRAEDRLHPGFLSGNGLAEGRSASGAVLVRGRCRSWLRVLHPQFGRGIARKEVRL